MPTKKELMIASILQTLLAGGVKLRSPYDVENWIEDNLTHENMCPFFYKDGRDIDTAVAIREVLKKTPR